MRAQIDFKQNELYQIGYKEGFIEGQNKAIKAIEKQLRLAYLSRPVVLKADDFQRTQQRGLS